MLKENRRKITILCIIIFCAVFMRVIALLDSDNFHGIAAGKIIEARRLLEHPDRLTAWIVPAHGPVHLYLVALSLKLADNSYTSACILSLLFGVGLLIPYFKLVTILFDENSAICSAFIIAFFPLHVVYSVLSTAETMFLFFLVSGLLFYIREQKTGRFIDLFVSALSLGIATLCRFEGGLFIILIIVLLLMQNYRKAFFFIAVSSILPMAWMWGNYLISGNFLQFLFASDTIVKTEFNFQRTLGCDLSFLKKISYWSMQIKSYFGWPIFIGGICGLIQYGFKKQYRDLTVILVSGIAFFTYKTLMEELAMQPRYGMSLGLLFIPFFVIFFMKILKLMQKNLRKPVLAIMLLYVIFRCAYLQSIMLPQTPYWVRQTALFLQQNVEEGQTVYIETEEDNIKAPLKIYSKLNDNQFADYNPFSQEVELMKPESREKLKFVVLISRRRLKNYEEVFRVNNCKIYQVKK